MSDKSLEQKLIDKYDGDISKATQAMEKLVVTKNKKIHNFSNAPIVVDIQDTTKVYKVGGQKLNALSNVSLQIQQGEFVALTGPSGSGKSTLLQLIGGLDKPTTGKIMVNDQNIVKLRDRKLSIFRNQTIGFVFQFFYLQPFLTLGRNLQVPGMFARVKYGTRKDISNKLAEKVSLSDRLAHLPNELSGGQMQRAAIARALFNNPKIILADEPTGNLDRENAFAIMELFDSIREQFNTTVIVVTHDATLAARADREIKLLDGKIQS